MLKIFIVFLILFSSAMLLPAPITVTDSLVDKSTADNNDTEHNSETKLYPNKTNNIYHKIIKPIFRVIKSVTVILKDPLLLLAGLLVGVFLNFWLNKKTIRMADIINRSNEIKAIFVDTFVTIDNFNSHGKVSIGDIVVNNIDATETLIQQFFFYVGNRKRKKIIAHYKKYIDPYFKDTRAFNLSYFMYSERMINNKPSKYRKTKIIDEKKRTIKHLKKLIDDFSLV